jgi:hypothetical protein
MTVVSGFLSDVLLSNSSHPFRRLRCGIEIPTYAAQILEEPHYNSNSGYSNPVAEGGLERDE